MVLLGLVLFWKKKEINKQQSVSPPSANGTWTRKNTLPNEAVSEIRILAVVGIIGVYFSLILIYTSFNFFYNFSVIGDLNTGYDTKGVFTSDHCFGVKSNGLRH